jgi:hypothetical protein
VLEQVFNLKQNCCQELFARGRKTFELGIWAGATHLLLQKCRSSHFDAGPFFQLLGVRFKSAVAVDYTKAA